MSARSKKLALSILCLALIINCNVLTLPTAATPAPTLAAPVASGPAPTAIATVSPEPPAPEPTATAIPLAPLIAPLPGVPLTPTDLYAFNVATGQWTEGQGLVTLLKLYVGEESSSNVAFSAELMDIEITELLALAESYVATGEDEAAQAELKRLLIPFNIPDEQLDLYSQPEVAAFAPVAHLARPVAAPSFQADAACASLLRGGFPPDSATLCYFYSGFTDNGNIYSVYYPASWELNDPRRQQLTAIKDALRASVTLYNGYGPAPIMRVRVVITELGEVRADGSPNPIVYAKALYPEGGATCRVGVLPAGLAIRTVEQLKQDIAHEIFHCYQYTNLAEQTIRSEETMNINRWWMEGSAVYFSDVVYPRSNTETDFNARLAVSANGRPLTVWSYDAYAFFEYLGNNAGWSVQDILRLLEARPVGSSERDELLSLTAYAGMLDIFHGFSQALIDGRVRETGGGVIDIAIEPQPAIPLPPVSGAPELATNNAFSINYYEIVLEAKKDYTFALTPSGGEGRSSAHLINTAAWGALPASELTSCMEARFRVLITAALPRSGSTHLLTLNYQTTGTSLPCDRCLIGRWQLDNESYFLLAKSLQPRSDPFQPTQLYMQRVTGGTTVSFAEDGTARTEMNGLTLASEMILADPETFRIVQRIKTELVFSGGNTGTYTTVDNRLSFTATGGRVDVNFYMDGQLAAQFLPTGAGDPGAMLGSNAEYVCTNRQLVIKPTVPIQNVKPNAPWLTFLKVQ